MTIQHEESSTAAAVLRAAMVDELRELGAVRDPRVARALAVVPRHLFAPGADLAAAYAATGTVVPVRDAVGRMVSTVSAPHIQAMMLEQARVAPGMRVLEVGSAGYNAALLAELVGETGEVTTVDILPGVAERARRCLDAAGYGRVRVVLADAEGGVPDHAPYDLVLVTTAVRDIPSAWTDQLAPGGRLVVPLRLRGQTRSVVFEADGGRLVGHDAQVCSFVPLAGAGAFPEQVLALDGDDVVVRLDDAAPVDVDEVRQALTWPRVKTWSGVHSGEEPFDDLLLWLAVGLENSGLLLARQAAVTRGTVAHAWSLGMPAVVGKGSLAYFSLSAKVPGRVSREFGVQAQGPAAELLTSQFIERIRAWKADRPARIEAFPAGTPDAALPAGGVFLDRPHRRVVVSWPSGPEVPV
ncbi:protein-L-isoaspartate carboxylmethyltransferase [Frankia casuarinae]|uniref:Protein-L-isoaspartate O-methyltransferase n=1 Tax=Frankia casuarinae (strain DSM 45818 / CECT 9043 / HFP020203 / CcI3) TaxID=106370 RepID=Q2JBZ7_FRACC|nr:MULTISPECIES: methyltransferase, FxLD system [Frankia]ABD11195.1 Protein-L-isoaspartate(D-aspartate) O-methyltransferase [Frankia casuarinae]ETA00024.1 protein-L-isoaspartate carboxylmethyltransferase [Frankia sp. CcI6]EYT91202.1 protein-L-isoaspartate carboxylmethyltransferase [Frankia casuarinae]KFB03270.1 methyltransferase, FxLD system [Frankia sp. Allo2]OAA18653.1 protein-L-isoaspartate(D-aspartate) O-methyltransferase [Frankia casuarinae]